MAAASSHLTLAEDSSSSATTEDTFTVQFLQLVDAWVEENPVETTALSSADIRYAAGKLLLIHRGRGVEDRSARLVAILLVLFMEGLAATGAADPEKSVLGFRMSEIFEIMRRLVRQQAITSEELVGAVMEVVHDPAMIIVAQSGAITAALFKADVAQVDTTSGSNTNTLQERVVKVKMLLRLRTVTLVAFGFFFFSFEISQMRPMLSSVVSMSFCAMAVLSMAIFFPHSISSRAACRFLLPPMLTVAVLGSSVWWWRFMHTWYHDSGEWHYYVDASKQTTAVGTAHTRYAHVFSGLTFQLNIMTSTVLCGLVRYNWTTFRLTLVVDGLLFGASCVMMHMCGSIDEYPPGSGRPLQAAMLRSLTPVVLGVVLSPEVRASIGGQSTLTAPLSLVRALDPHDNNPHDNWKVTESARIGIDGRVGYSTNLLPDIAMRPAVGEVAGLAVREQLARRYLRVRLVLVLFSATWFILADYLKLWDFGKAYPTWWFQRPTMVFALCLGGALMVLSASFPSDIRSSAGRNFLLPATIVCAVCATIASVSGYYSGVQLGWHPNEACHHIHLTLCILISGFYWTSFFLCLASRCTWSVLRVTLVIDSFTFTALNYALYRFGTSVYQPRGCTVEQAMMRAAIPLMFSAVFTPATRHRISDFATQYVGWNHVTLTLNQIQQPARRRKVRFSPSADSAACRTPGDEAGDAPSEPSGSFETESQQSIGGESSAVSSTLKAQPPAELLKDVARWAVRRPTGATYQE